MIRLIDEPEAQCRQPLTVEEMIARKAESQLTEGPFGNESTAEESRSEQSVSECRRNCVFDGLVGSPVGAVTLRAL